MQKTFKNIMQSFVVFPVLTASLALSPFTGIVAGSPSAAAIFSDQTRTLSSEEADNQQQITEKAAKIDTYLTKRGSPLAGYGRKFVESAEANGLPTYSVVAVAIIESGGTNPCFSDKDNYFGWGSCKGEKFNSVSDAIDTVASTLGGNSDNPKMVRVYKDKTFEQKLIRYNGGVNLKYVPNIKIVMQKIEGMQIDESLALVKKSDA
jgi:hypothetical protein